MLETAKFSVGEVIALWGVLGTAVLGLLYAAFLMGQVLREDKGTAKMQEIAQDRQFYFKFGNPFLLADFSLLI